MSGVAPGSARSLAALGQRPPRLTIRVVVYTAILIGIGAATLLVFIRHFERGRAESTARLQASVVTQGVVDRLAPSDLLGTADPGAEGGAAPAARDARPRRRDPGRGGRHGRRSRGLRDAGRGQLARVALAGAPGEHPVRSRHERPRRRAHRRRDDAGAAHVLPVPAQRRVDRRRRDRQGLRADRPLGPPGGDRGRGHPRARPHLPVALPDPDDAAGDEEHPPPARHDRPAGAPRRPHGAGEPRAPRRPPGRAVRAALRPARVLGLLHRPRPVQGRQRHPRARPRQRAPRRGRPPALPRGRRGRARRAARRRRVRGRERERDRRRRRALPRRAALGGDGRHVRDRRDRPGAAGEHRHRARPGARLDARRAAPLRRHRDVRRQAVGRAAGVRPRARRPLTRAPRHGRRAPPRPRATRARRLLPAAVRPGRGADPRARRRSSAGVTRPSGSSSPTSSWPRSSRRASRDVSPATSSRRRSRSCATGATRGSTSASR